MKKKHVCLLFLLFSQLCISQRYADLFSINYGKSATTTYENLSQTTIITNFDTNLTLPIELNEKDAIISGIDFSVNTLQLFPDSNYTNLYLTRLKAGIHRTHNEHWSGTYILLPKISSDYINLSFEDFYIGGVAVLKYKKNTNLIYRIGLYASNESFGLFATPIIGLYYLSPNSHFEMNLGLPNDADLNYRFTNRTKIGVDYFARGKSFKLTSDDMRSTYAENNSLELSSYIQNNSLFKNILFRLKIGFSTNSFKVYPIDQKIDFAISGFKFNDNRTQLNTNLSSSSFIKFEAIYRLDITSK